MQVPNFIKLEDAPCPNGCSGRSSEVMSGRDLLNKLPGIFSIYRCSECGLERTNPRPTPDTIGYYYPPSYAPYENRSILHGKKGLRYFLLNFFGLVDRKLPNVKPGNMLEIGCASGAYMQYAEKCGWQVEGIEFSVEAANTAKSKGFQVSVGAIESVNQPQKKYNVIVAWMVLEHLHEPVTVLKKMKTWIKSDGYLVFSVPDRNSLARKIFKENSYDIQVPTHLYHFDINSLKITLNNSGWKIEKIIWQKNANTMIKSFENWVIDKKINWLLPYLKSLEQNRIGSYLRVIFGIIMGFTRQSGRIEVWARPIS